jgi:hypothetical protein
MWTKRSGSVSGLTQLRENPEGMSPPCPYGKNCRRLHKSYIFELATTQAGEAEPTLLNARKTSPLLHQWVRLFPLVKIAHGKDAASVNHDPFPALQ